MTLISMFFMLLRKRINLRERLLLMQSSGNLSLKDVTGLIRRILLGTLLFEGLGALALSFRFVPRYGWAEGLYNSVFHAVSAFCNAGFDLFGKEAPFSSLSTLSDDLPVLLTVMILIIVGGIGFIVWDDVAYHKWRLKAYSLHSKLALSTTVILLLGGTVFFYFSEADASMAGMGEAQRWLSSAFQSVTLRTAGFNTIDQSALSGPGSILSRSM